MNFFKYLAAKARGVVGAPWFPPEVLLFPLDEEDMVLLEDPAEESLAVQWERMVRSEIEGIKTSEVNEHKRQGQDRS